MVFKKGNKFGGKKKILNLDCCKDCMGQPNGDAEDQGCQNVRCHCHIKETKNRFDKMVDDEEVSDDKPRCKTCNKVVSSDLIEMCYNCVEKKQPGGVFAPPQRYISGTNVKTDKPKEQ